MQAFVAVMGVGHIVVQQLCVVLPSNVTIHFKIYNGRLIAEIGGIPCIFDTPVKRWVEPKGHSCNSEAMRWLASKCDKFVAIALIANSLHDLGSTNDEIGKILAPEIQKL